MNRLLTLPGRARVKNQCPRCGVDIGWEQHLRFLRLVSIRCPRCRALLALDRQGRYALWGPLAVAVILAVLLEQIAAPASVCALVVLAGLPAAALAASRLGRLGISAEDAGSRK
jgi:phage FluMu protein Com